KKSGQVGILLCCTLGALWITIIYYKSVRFESNDSYLWYTKNDSERR
ncbi:Uncharacterized protein FWK35_00036988, partial [Aphis craccivora]